MPLVRISLNTGDPAFGAAIGTAVHRALVECMNVPADDRFQVISAGATGHVIWPPQYLGIAHSEAVVIVQITLNGGRTVEQKRALYARIAELASVDPGVPKADMIVNLIEVSKENWSFGDGIAQYA